MNRSDKPSASAEAHTDATRSSEEKKLDEGILAADARLVASLQEEERLRLRRLWWRWTIGGILMATTTIAVVLVSLVGFPGRGTDADLAQASALAQDGWSLWRKQLYAEAAKKFEKAVELDPESTKALNGLGWSRFNGGADRAAEEPFRSCIRLEPSHAAALNGLGQIYLFRGELERAEGYLLKAAKNNASAAWYGLVRLYLLQEKFDEAEKWAQKLVDSGSSDKTVEKMLQAAKAKKLDPKLRDRIAPSKKSQQSAETKRGWFFFQRGENPRAIREFRKALAKDPKDLSAQNGLGFSLLNSGKATAAKKLFTKILDLEPNHAGAMNGLARCLKDEGKVDEAIALWQKMVEEFPGPHAGTTGLAWAHLERKEYDKAVKYFEELVTAHPDDARTKKGLARAHVGVEKAGKNASNKSSGS